MPKQTYVIRAFHGGKNDNNDPRDIAPEESAELINADISNVGKLSLLGGWIEHEATSGTVDGETALTGAFNRADDTVTTEDTNAGGFFRWAADYHYMDTNGLIEDNSSSNHEGAVDLLAVFHAVSPSEIHIFQKSGTTLDWSDGTAKTDAGPTDSATIKFEGGSSGEGIPCMYAVDGILRASEMYTSASKPKWLGYIPAGTYAQHYLSTSTQPLVYRTGVTDAENNYGAWFLKDREIKPCLPEVTISGKTYGSNAIMCNNLTDGGGTGDYNSEDGFGFENEIVDTGYHPAAVATAAPSQMAWGVHLGFQEDADGENSGTWQPQNDVRYKFYVSTIYDGNQESLPQLFQHYDSETIKDGGIKDYVGTAADDEIYFVNGTLSSGVPTGGQINNMAVGFIPVFKANGVWDIDSDGTRQNKNIWGASDVQATGDTEFITNTVDRDFSGSGNWSAYDESGTDVTVSVTGGYLLVNVGSDTTDEGAQLADAYLETLTAARRYLVTANLQSSSGNIVIKAAIKGGDGAIFHAVDGLGGNAAGNVGTIAQDYIASPLAGSGTDQLIIYVEANNADFKIHDISVKEWTAGQGNPRITGARIYFSDSQEGHGNLWQLFDCDFSKGTKAIGTSGYGSMSDEGWIPWTTHRVSSGEAPDGDSDFNYFKPKATNTKFVDPPRYISYSMLNGHGHSEPIDAEFKFAVLANRRIYGANVKQEIELGGDVVHYGDRIIKSPINQFDKFPKSNFIEATTNDGQSITGMKGFADRLFVFKESKLEIINIGKDDEFLEATHHHMGVKTDSAICETDYGLAWVNKDGCFLFDGERIVNLLEKEGKRRISSTEWGDEIGDDSYIRYPMIQYHKKKRQLIVVDDSSAGPGDMYIYDMGTQGWVFSPGTATYTSDHGSNMLVDYNGQVTFYNYSNDTMLRWSDTKIASAKFQYLSPDIDFGEPGIRKKIYKVFLSFKGNGTHVQVQYGVNGLDPASNFYPITSGTDGSSTGTGAAAKCIAYDAGTTDWLCAELKPGASINNIYSFQLKIHGDNTNAIAADFEINDITIVWRAKKP